MTNKESGRLENLIFLVILISLLKWRLHFTEFCILYFGIIPRSEMSRTPSPYDYASQSNTPIPYNDVPVFSSYAGTCRPPMAPPASFVAGFAHNFPRNPIEAALPGTVGQLNEKGFHFLVSWDDWNQSRNRYTAKLSCALFPSEARTQAGKRKDEKQEKIHFKNATQAQRFSLMWSRRACLKL